MRTSVSCFDALFGRKVTAKATDSRGRSYRICVTEKWLEKSLAEKRVGQAPENSIALFLHGPDDEKLTTLKIGEEIDHATVEGFRDKQTGALYGLFYFEGGHERTFLVQREQYIESKQRLSSPKHKAVIESEVNRALGVDRD